MNLTIGELITMMGVPSAVTGLIVWSIKAKQAKVAEQRKAKDDALSDILLAIVLSINSCMTLAKATAKAVQRIPDAKCNGDMDAALEQAEEIMREQEKVFKRLGISAGI